MSQFGRKSQCFRNAALLQSDKCHQRSALIDFPIQLWITAFNSWQLWRTYSFRDWIYQPGISLKATIRIVCGAAHRVVHVHWMHDYLTQLSYVSQYFEAVAKLCHIDIQVIALLTRNVVVYWYVHSFTHSAYVVHREADFMLTSNRSLANLSFDNYLTISLLNGCYETWNRNRWPVVERREPHIEFVLKRLKDATQNCQLRKNPNVSLQPNIDGVIDSEAHFDYIGLTEYVTVE